MSAARKLHLWCLFDIKTRKTLDGLLFDEARAIISSVDAHELGTWYVWREGWPDWRPVQKVDGLTETIVRSMPVTPPPPPAESDVDFDGPQGMAPTPELSLTGITQSDPLAGGPISDSDDFVVRSKKRYKKRFQVRIELNGNIYKSWTRDISVGGINLEDALPLWVTGYFKVRISKPNNKQQIELQCCLVETEEAYDRHRLMILPLQNPEDEQNLEKWIAS